MANDNKSLQILIEFIARTQGAQAAKQALTELKDATAQASAATKANANVEDAAAKKTNLFGLGRRELYHITNLLRQSFPLASEVFLAAWNPMIAAITAGVTVFVLAKRQIDDMNKKLDEQAKLLAEPIFVDAIKARRDALVASAVAQAEFNSKVHLGRTAEEIYGVQLERTLAVQKLLAAGQQQVSDARQKLLVAQLSESKGIEERHIEQLAKSGYISAEQASQAKIALDVKYFEQLTRLEEKHDQEKLAREIALEDQLAEIKKAQAEKLAANQAALEAKANASIAAAAVQTARADELKAKLADIETEIGKLLPQVGDAQKKYEIAASNLQQFNSVLPANPTGTQLAAQAELQRRADVAYQPVLGALDQLKASRAHLTGELGGSESQARIAQSAADRATTAAENNRSKSQELLDQYNNEKEAARLRRQFNSDAQKFGVQADETNILAKNETLEVGGFNLAEIARLERQKALQGRSGVNPLTKGEQSQVAAFEQFATANGTNVDKIIQLLFVAAGTASTQAAKIKALETLYSDLSARQKDSRIPGGK